MIFDIKYLLFCYALVFNAQLLAQISQKSKIIQIKSDLVTDSLYLNSTIDGNSTFTRTSFFNIWENLYYQSFEPFNSLKIANKGIKKINKPRLVFNETGNWFDKEVLTNEIFKNSQTDKEKVLNLWHFLSNNRIHYNPPSMDGYVNYNMLMSYGYGTCDITAYLARIAMNYIGYAAESKLMVHHTVAEIKTLEANYLLDSDLDVFYLDYNNSNIIGFNNVIKDKYLIYRTKHFGKNIIYDKNVDKWVSSLYYQDKFEKIKRPVFKNTSSGPKTYDFILRPGESIEYSWDKANKYVQKWENDTLIPETFKNYILANGTYKLETNFESTQLNELFDEYNAISVDTSGVFSNLYTTSDTAYLILAVKSPFAIVEANLKCKYFQTSMQDSVEVYWSNDNINWERKKKFSSMGFYQDTINLQSNFSYIVNDQSILLTYEYYLKFIFCKQDSTSVIGIDSIYLENTFQVSRFFLPKLLAGLNHFVYTDLNGADTLRNIEVTINWQETNENHPPFAVEDPVFPSDNEIVDSLYFGFSWNPASDTDGDSIADYEFYLSDRPDMMYPLSPNFNIFVSSFGNGIKPFFKIKETGWLNDGITYYWKVRAKDLRGAWGDWSPIWSFTPKGVMQPVIFTTEINSERLILKWGKNNIGKTPDYYKIFASNEDEGFVPETSNILSVSTDSTLVIRFDGNNPLKSFYRVSACTSDNQESLPSKYIAIPYPTLFYITDTVSTNKFFKIQFGVTKKYRPIYYYKEDTIFYNSNIIFESIPNWLSVEQNSISGFADYQITRKINYVDSFSKLVIRLVNDSGFFQSHTLRLVSDIVNNPPSLYLSDSLAIVGKKYESFVSTNDGDYLYGDINNFEVIDKPDWLSYKIQNDTIFLFGITGSANIENEHIEIKATDSKGFSVNKTFKIKKYYSTSTIVSIMPNPLKEEATILMDLNEESIVTIELYNIQGIKLKTIFKNRELRTGINVITFDASELKPDIYILKNKVTGNITNDINFYNLKFIKI